MIDLLAERQIGHVADFGGVGKWPPKFDDRLRVWEKCL
jgi:hypothetical protein